jgi:predicted house-cleaning noncanonical NTP pyrophosphatase (MazG superfamily)
MDSKKPSKIRVLNKLGSDNIHEILEPQGGKAITRTLSEEEFKIALFNKLQEEVTEFLEDPIAEELSDILNVIHALAPLVAGSMEELEKIRQAKLKIRGGFEKKIFIIEIHDK